MKKYEIDEDTLKNLLYNDWLLKGLDYNNVWDWADMIGVDFTSFIAQELKIAEEEVYEDDIDFTALAERDIKKFKEIK